MKIWKIHFLAWTGIFLIAAAILFKSPSGALVFLGIGTIFYAVIIAIIKANI